LTVSFGMLIEGQTRQLIPSPRERLDIRNVLSCVKMAHFFVKKLIDEDVAGVAGTSQDCNQHTPG
jgi:hypothetical protein